MVVWASRALKRTVNWIPDRRRPSSPTCRAATMSRSPRWRSTRTAASSAAASRPTPHSAPISAISAPSSRPLAGSAMLAGLYQTPAIYVNVKGVMTNTVPTDAYRGAGRPEAAYLLERFVDHVARETGLRPTRSARRNFITPDQMPVSRRRSATPTTRATSSGDAQGHGEGRLDGFAARRGRTRRGKWRGIGMATYVENCGGGAAGDRDRQVQRRRHGHALRRQPDQRPGPRDGDTRRSPRRGSASTPSGSTSCRATPTWCPEADRRQPHRLGRRRGDGRRGRQDHRQGQAGGGQHAGSGCGRHRVCRRRLQDRRHRPQR